jgi:hypothetical protein
MFACTASCSDRGAIAGADDGSSGAVIFAASLPQSMIPKSGHRFSEKIMLQQRI